MLRMVLACSCFGSFSTSYSLCRAAVKFLDLVLVTHTSPGLACLSVNNSSTSFYIVCRDAGCNGQGTGLQEQGQGRARRSSRHGARVPLTANPGSWGKEVRNLGGWGQKPARASGCAGSIRTLCTLQYRLSGNVSFTHCSCHGMQHIENFFPLRSVRLR